MSNICKTVSLRTRKIKNGTQLSFYLDYYPGYRDEATMEVHQHESLGIYIFTKPKNQREKDYNERMTEKAEAIRCRRYESIVNERYDFFDREKMKGDFLAYFKALAAKRNARTMQAYEHFAFFTDNKCTFMELTVDLCVRFREYLLNEALSQKSKEKPQKLHVNTASLYWSSFRGVLHTAHRDHKIQENPNSFLDKIEKIPTEKEHLSQDELIRLANTPCTSGVLKKAFLFSCLTGLRFSDVKALTWEKIQPYGDGGMFISVRMIKTKQFVNNPISDEALELIGFERDADGNAVTKTGRVFPGLKTSLTQTDLPNWLKAAGITKHITFHCSRHTFGSLQVDAGTGIYTVQHMLGHKNVETTQIYANMADESKRESVNRITLKPKPAPELKVVGLD